MEWHLYSYLPDSKSPERAARIVNQGFPTFLHFHRLGQACVLGCRKVTMPKYDTLMVSAQTEDSNS